MSHDASRIQATALPQRARQACILKQRKARALAKSASKCRREISSTELQIESKTTMRRHCIRLSSSEETGDASKHTAQGELALRSGRNHHTGVARRGCAGCAQQTTNANQRIQTPSGQAQQVKQKTSSALVARGSQPRIRHEIGRRLPHREEQTQTQTAKHEVSKSEATDGKPNWHIHARRNHEATAMED